MDAVLEQLAQEKDVNLNWQKSIVNLLKLLELKSSLPARNILARNLNIHVGQNGSPEQNLALHEVVVEELAVNGGRVPAKIHSWIGPG